jgi:hypothetical protein
MYSKLVELIQDHSDQLAQELVKDLLSRNETRSYKKLHKKDVYRRAYEVYSNLGSWLSKDNPKEELIEHYTRLGKRRFEEGIPLNEVIMALMLIKRHLWLYIYNAQFYQSSFEIYQSLEMNNRVVLFFDKAIHFTAMGYEDAFNKEKERQAELAKSLDSEEEQSLATV